MAIRRKIRTTWRTLAAPLLLALGLAATPWTAATPAVDLPDTIPVLGVQGQVHYLPFDGANFLALLRGEHGTSTAVENPVRLITSMVSALDGNEVAIDHWEDGYDADPIAAPGATTETLTLDEGQTNVLDNWVDTALIGSLSPGGSGQPYYDGGDRLVSTGALVVTAGGWPTNATTLHANAAIVPEVDAFGYDFESPVGEDTPYNSATLSPWEYTGFLIVASEDDTTVTVDGVAPFTLDAGESHLVDGGVDLGDHVHADRPVLVYLGTGDKLPSSGYEGRLFRLRPTEDWSDDYVSPVGSRNNGSQASRVFLYNPGASAITVTWTESGGATGTVSVPAGGQANYEITADRGARFTSSGNPFYAVEAITTPDAGQTDESARYNWGIALTPTEALTPMVVIGYGPGSEDGTENDSPVWVAPMAATTIYVDLDADPTTGAGTDGDGNHYDFTCSAAALQPVLIKDIGSTSCSPISTYTNAVSGSGDADMTGARIYTDGTPIAAAWGQVPGLNQVQPAIDMGTNVLPFPTIDLLKEAEVLNDDGDGKANPGDTIRYTITATNRGISPVDNLTLTDELPANVSYVPGSTSSNGSPIADDGVGSPFPLDEGGLLLPPALDVSETRTVVFDLLVDDPLPDGVTQIVNQITLATDYGTYTDTNVQPTADPGSIGDRVWNDLDRDGTQDGGEPGLNGVTVNLRDGGDNLVDTTTTSGDGDYSFASVYPGTYTVEIDTGTLPPGLQPTFDRDGLGTPDEASVGVVEAQSVTDADFGYALAPISLEKTVYKGWDGGAGCPGSDSVSGVNGRHLTYCFALTNTGSVNLTAPTVDDPDLGVDETAMTLVTSPSPWAPGTTVVFAYETAIDGDLHNTATGGGTLPGGGQVSDDDDATVDELTPAILLAKGVYAGHDGGAACGSAGGSVSGELGAPVTWCFTVTNDGETDLAVSIDDPDLGIDDGDMTVLSGSLAPLAPGQSATLYLEGSIDGDLANTATATGTSPDDTDVTASDSAAVDELVPALALVKNVYGGHDGGTSCNAATDVLPRRNGQPVTYCFTVTNTGDTTLTGIQVDDPDLAIDQTDMGVVSGSLASLAPGATVRLSYETNVDGDLVNTATATGTSPADAEVTDSDSAAVDEYHPAIQIEKTVYVGQDGGASCAGGESVAGVAGTAVTYCFDVTNTGDVALSEVAFWDDDLSIDNFDLNLPIGDWLSIAPGATLHAYYEATIDGDLVNTANVLGDGPYGGASITDSDTASVDELHPALALDKTVYAGHDGGASCAGGESVTALQDDPVTYCFVVTNTGDDPLSDVTVTDLDLGVDQSDLDVVAGSLASVAPGQSVTLAYETTVDGDLVNTATASATPSSGPDPTDTDGASVDQIAPDIGLSKTAYAGHDDGASCEGTPYLAVPAGADVTWCFTVTNPGDADLTGLSLDDLDLGIDEGDVQVASGSLASVAPGGTVTLYYEGTAAADLVNTASVSGVPPVGPPRTDEDTATVDTVQPGIDVAKTVYLGHDAGASCDGAESVAGEAGDAVTWCFVVTNTGDSTLAPIHLDDADLGIDEGGMSVLSGSLASLDPGESVWLYAQGAVDGDLTNTVTASGTPVDQFGDPVVGTQDVTDQDTASIDELVPSVAVEDTVYRGHDSGASCPGGELATGRLGDAVTYCFAVTNTGDTDLDITLDDPALGIDESDVTVLSGTLTGLAPGATVVVRYDDVVNGDLVNTVTATGTTPSADQVTAEDPSEVDQVAPSVQIDKTVYLGHDDGASCDGAESAADEAGQPVTWCFTVTNTGDARLGPVTIADAALGVDQTDLSAGSGALSPLDPGESATLYLEGTIDGDLTNTATVTATPQDRNGSAVAGPDETDSDDASVDRLDPELGVAKTLAEAPRAHGNGTYSITYRIRVANTGEVLLHDVQVTDDLSDAFEGAAAFEVEDLASDDLSVNWPGYTGTPGGSLDLLAGTDTLGVGERRDVLLTVRLDPGDDLGPYLNTALAAGTSPAGDDVADASDSGSDADPGGTNPGEPGDSGGSDDPVPVSFPAVDLEVTKTVADIHVEGNEALIDWRIVVTNLGPGNDPGPITVVDELPDALSHGLVTASGEGWDCEIDEGTITCTWEDPLPAEESTSEIQVQTPYTITGDAEVTNGATVASTRTEASLDNNESSAVAVTEVGDDPTGSLPRTGAAIGTLLALGIALVATGRTLVGHGRKRQGRTRA